MAIVGHDQHFVHQAGNVLAGRNTGDGAGEDVVEHQRGDAQLGESPAEGFFDHAVDAAAGEHGAAFDVHSAYGEAEEHDAEDEPGGSGANGLLGDASCIKGGGT